MKKNYVFGAAIYVAGRVFAQIETIYFGNNFLPMSYAEIGADAIACGLMLAGIYFITKGFIEALKS